MNYVSIEKHGEERVAVITMNYKKENRLNPDLIAELMQALDELEKDAEVGAIVLTGGDPKFFCNGLDLEWIMMHFTDPAAIGGYLKSINTLYHRFTLYPKPTVAALNGHTFAGGLFIACHMDFRFMREDRGWICLPEIDINIPLLPGMVAICQAVMTPQTFHKLYYTGGRFTGPEALEMGFADAIYPEADLLPKCVEFAGMLAKKKTKTYTEMKRRIRADIARIIEEEDPKHFAATLAFSMPGK